VITLLSVACALASDPAALRDLNGEPLAIDAGSDGLSIAARSGSWVWVTNVDPGAWAGLSLGRAMRLTSPDRPWGVDATLSAGLAGLLATPGVGLLASGGIRGGLHGERAVGTVGLVAPAAIRLDTPVQAILPLALEAHAGARLGNTWLGARGQAGSTLQVSGPPAVRVAVAGWISVPLKSSGAGS